MGRVRCAIACAHLTRRMELMLFRAAPRTEAIGSADGDDRVGLQRVEVVLPLGNLRGQVALNLKRDGVGCAGDVGALRLRLVIAGPAGQIRIQ